jgi:hypothetical protein
MHMMALTSGALETCARALGTYVPSYRGRSARLFFMLEARDPQGVTGHVVAHGALPSREAGSRAVGHVAAVEPSLVGRQGSKPWYTSQHRSPPEEGGSGV